MNLARAADHEGLVGTDRACVPAIGRTVEGRRDGEAEMDGKSVANSIESTAHGCARKPWHRPLMTRIGARDAEIGAAIIPDGPYPPS